MRVIVIRLSVKFEEERKKCQLLAFGESLTYLSDESKKLANSRFYTEDEFNRRRAHRTFHILS